MINKIAVLTFSVFMILLAPESSHSSGKADEIMRQVYEQSRVHKSQRMDIEMDIKDPKGRKRARFFRVLYKIDDGKTKSLMRFYKPTDIKGTGLFNVIYDHEDKESDQWIYFPAFRTVKKLSVEEKHQSFMGSDFTNSDIAGRKPSEDTHTLVEPGEEISVVSSVPKDPEEPYSKIESHILNRIKVPEKVLFYDRSGRLLKSLNSKKIVKIEGMYVIVEAEMENHLSGGSTYIMKRSIDFKKIKSGDVTVSKLQNR